MKRDINEVRKIVAEQERVIHGAHFQHEYWMDKGVIVMVANAGLEKLDARMNYNIDLVNNSTRGMSIKMQERAKLR